MIQENYIVKDSDVVAENGKQKNKTRTTLDLSLEMSKELDDLVILSHSTDKAEALRTAIKVAKIIFELKKDGKEFLIINGNHIERLIVV